MQMQRWIRHTALALAIASTMGAVPAAPKDSDWVGTWATAQMLAEGANALDPTVLNDATLRQIVRVSVGGKTIRLRLSNAFARAPLRVAGVHIARAKAPGTAIIDPATDRSVTFDGQSDVLIPPGAEYTSDPIVLDVPDRGDLAISIRLDTKPQAQTGHPGSRTTSFLLQGNHLSDTDLPDAAKIDRWYLISAIDIVAPTARAVAIIGDSITDGRGSTTNGNDRWTDLLSARLNAETRAQFGVLNFGIGGNRVLDDGIGPNALSRFYREILSQNGVKTLIVFEGVNDLGALARKGTVDASEHAALVARLVGAYRQMVQNAHAHGMRVIGATILPYGGSEYYHPDATNEADRQALNAWIRTKGNFDAVIDFDAALRDPAHPDRLHPAYDVGDHIHPNAAGYKAMADAIPLQTIVP